MEIGFIEFLNKINSQCEKDFTPAKKLTVRYGVPALLVADYIIRSRKTTFMLRAKLQDYDTVALIFLGTFEILFKSDSLQLTYQAQAIEKVSVAYFVAISEISATVHCCTLKKKDK